MEKSVPEHLPDEFSFLIPVSVYIQSGLQDRNKNKNHGVPPVLLGGLKFLISQVQKTSQSAICQSRTLALIFPNKTSFYPESRDESN